MERLGLFVAICFISVVHAQINCPNKPVLFLVDLSENARVSSTHNSNYDILTEALNKFFGHVNFSTPGSNISFAVCGYSSAPQVEILVPAFTSPPEAVRLINNASVKTTSAGSWTMNAFECLKNIANTALTDITAILISSQGSNNEGRVAQAANLSNQARANGLQLRVLAVQGSNAINMTELTLVNNGAPPTVVTDPSPVVGSPPKGYLGLYAELQKMIPDLICKTSPTTLAPTTPAPITPAPTNPAPTNPAPSTAPAANGVCSKCLYDGGYAFDFDVDNCDGYYLCKEGTQPINLACPAGTVWSGITCDHIGAYQCAAAGGRCKEDTSAGTLLLSSKRCCNKYFDCVNGKFVERSCSRGLVFNNDTKKCEIPADKTSAYSRTVGQECDIDNTGSSDRSFCSQHFARDPTGNICKYMQDGQLMDTPAGTEFNYTLCTLVRSRNCPPPQTSDRDIEQSDACNANFLATFNGGSKEIFSERNGAYFPVSTVTNEVMLADNAVVFTQEMASPYLYWYYFNNNAIGTTFAMRLRFILKNARLGATYDLLSNNYCSLCEETISFTAIFTAANNLTIFAKFMTDQGIVQSIASISLINVKNFVEIRIVWDVSSLYGVCIERDSMLNVVQTSQFPVTAKSSGLMIKPNKCGIQLGRGRNEKFVGPMDEFAVHKNCKNIASVLV